jgi:hypothetical protein
LGARITSSGRKPNDSRDNDDNDDDDMMTPILFGWPPKEGHMHTVVALGIDVTSPRCSDSPRLLPCPEWAWCYCGSTRPFTPLLKQVLTTTPGREWSTLRT